MRLLLGIVAIAALTVTDAGAQANLHSSITSRHGSHSTVASNIRGIQQQPIAPKTTITPPKKFQKSNDAVNLEKSCGNNQCYSYWSELTHPHDSTYQGRLKAQKAYNDCMARCVAAPTARR
jgi:hypothetical protein